MPDESEWKTRKRLIDPKLLAAGWKIACYDSAHPLGKDGALAIEEFPTENGSGGKADAGDSGQTVPGRVGPDRG